MHRWQSTQTRRRPRRVSRNLLSTALTSTRMECEFTRLRILKTANNRWVRRRSVVTGVTVSASITKAHVRTMVVFRAGSTEWASGCFVGSCAFFMTRPLRNFPALMDSRNRSTGSALQRSGPRSLQLKRHNNVCTESLVSVLSFWRQSPH